mgnify:CR=1 FL=1
MFSKIIALIRRGVLPPSEQLQTILKPAMVKKTGVMQQPRPCWSNDPKINPDAGHMLWAAILLEDQELISMATAMLFDLGVFLTVLGAVMLMLFSLSRIARAAGETVNVEPMDFDPSAPETNKEAE